MIKDGIERRMLAVTLVPMFVLSVLLGGYFTYTSYLELDRGLQVRGSLLASQVAVASEYPVFAGNHALLQAQVQHAMTQADVGYIAILGPSGQILANAGEKRGGGIPEHLAEARSEAATFIRIYHPILPTQVELDELGAEVNIGKPLGWILVEISKERGRGQKLEMLLFNLLLTLMLMMLSLMVALWVSRRITLPIRGMSHAVKRIGAGNLDTRISRIGVSELDDLALGVNEMAKQLQLDRSELQQRIADATQQLREKKEEAEKANQDKSRFLAAASHDLRQPMHALGLFVGELNERLDSPEHHTLLEKLEESVDALTGLLDSLLDISKLESGVILPQVGEVSLDALFVRLEREFMPLARSKNITLRVVRSAVTLESDTVLLERILINLLSNAIRYTSVGGRVMLVCRRAGESRVRIEVRDNGVGIPEEEHRNIFNEFFQLSQGGQNMRKGMGLGLAIVDRLAKLLRHPLAVRSCPKQGSLFSIEIPRRQFKIAPPLPGYEQSSVARDTKSEELADLRVLVVDDDALVRESAGGILTSWGCRSLLAENLQDALRCEQPDILICDYRLPDGDGVQLALRLSAMHAQAPGVIIVSGDTNPEVRKHVEALGFQMLHKPVRPAKLRSLILFLLQERRGVKGRAERGP